MHRSFFPTCALEVAKVTLLSCCVPVLLFPSYQSAAISHFVHQTCAILAPSKFSKCRYFCFCPSCALEVTKVFLFIFVHAACALELTECRYFCVPLPPCGLDVTKVSLFMGFSIRLAPSKLPKCRYFQAHRPFCGLEVTTVSLCIGFSTRRATSKVPKCRCFRVPIPSCALEVTKVSLCIIFSTRLAPSKLRKTRYVRVPLLSFPSCALGLPKCHYYYLKGYALCRRPFFFVAPFGFAGSPFGDIWEPWCLLFDILGAILACQEHFGEPFWHVGSILGGILAPWDHLGGPWEQQD